MTNGGLMDNYRSLARSKFREFEPVFPRNNQDNGLIGIRFKAILRIVSNKTRAVLLGSISLRAFTIVVLSLPSLWLYGVCDHVYGFGTAKLPAMVYAENTESADLPVQKEEEERTRRYHWLFRERKAEEGQKEIESTTVLDKLDREIKQARKLYLAGETDNAILKYRSAIDNFESILADTPQGSPLLKQVEQRFQVFDELATKILGPLYSDIPEDAAPRIFHLMEKRRICLRNLTLKKVGRLEFFDVPNSLLREESETLASLLELSEDFSTVRVRQSSEDALRVKLTEVRKAIQKSSEKYARFRSGFALSLSDVRRDLLRKDEMILDFNLFPDRLVIGVLTLEKAIYYQFPAVRSEIDRNVFQLQDKLREFSSGDQSTFMGHAWKEPCRRTYRMLLGMLPTLPKDKTTVFVIPDRSLWYLPFSSLLDSEDRPFGQDRVVTIMPSVDALKFLRSQVTSVQQSVLKGNLLLFESIPSIPDDHSREKTSVESTRKRNLPKESEEEKLERLILTNPVYPKPSDIVMKVQKMFAQFDVWMGPTATLDRFMEYTDRKEIITVLAVPLSVWDSVYGDRQPTFFFSPDKTGKRRFEANRFFAAPLGAGILVMPISWFNLPDKENPLGEGPLLLNTALFYSGFRMGMVNYSDPNWGSDEPFLLALLRKVAEKVPPGKALAEYPREMPAGLDPSFSGKPPSWAGWILSGDPGL